ncbi:uncharacterized protein LOC126056412 [Helicoverpa armigera]|uniref:uncharacterized protein LOC126056412 n=1 Tax=Helicoverpa armigera TaxID=29058 RepID=UPI00308396DE
MRHRNGGGRSFQQCVAANLKDPLKAVVRCIGTTRGQTMDRIPCFSWSKNPCDILVSADPLCGVTRCLPCKYAAAFSPHKSPIEVASCVTRLPKQPAIYFREALVKEEPLRSTRHVEVGCRRPASHARAGQQLVAQVAARQAHDYGARPSYCRPGRICSIELLPADTFRTDNIAFLHLDS